MAEVGNLKITIEGDAKDAIKALNAVNDQAKKTSKDTAQATKKASSGFDNFKGAISKATSVLGPMAAGAGAAIAAIGAIGLAAGKAATQFGTWSVSMSRSTRQLSRNAKAAGIGVEQYQALSATFERFGADADDLQDTLGTLADRAQDAAQGAQGPKEDFELLGIAVSDLRGKNPEQLLDTVATGLKEVQDPAKRMAAAARILGDDLARKLVPLLSEGEEGLRRFKEEARASGQVLSGEAVAGAQRFLETLERLQRVIDGVKKTVFASIVPAMNLLVDTVDAAVASFSDFNVDIEFAQRVLFGFTKRAVLTAIDALGGLTGMFQDVLKGLSFFNQGIKMSAKMVVAFGQGFTAVKTAVIATKNLIAGFVSDILSGLVSKLSEAIGFLADLADTAGMDGLSGALRQAQNAGKDFNKEIQNFSSDQIEKANKGFEKAKEEANKISDVLEIDLKNSLDAMIKRLGDTNNNLRDRLIALRRKLQATQFQPTRRRDSPDQGPSGGGGGGGGEATTESIDLAKQLASAWGAVSDKAKEWRDTIRGWLDEDGQEVKEESDDILGSWRDLVGAVGEVGSAISRLPGVSDKVGTAVQGITAAMAGVLGTIQAAIAASTTLGTVLAAATGGLSVIAGIIGTVASLASSKGKDSSSNQEQDQIRNAREMGKAAGDQIVDKLNRELRPLEITVQGAQFGSGTGAPDSESLRMIADGLENEIRNRPNSILNNDSGG